MDHPDTAESPELHAARLARESQSARVAAGAQAAPVVAAPVKDPLPFCVWTTVALLAWLFSPALVVAAFAAFGLRAYWQAWRAGLRQSNCILGDPRLVMLYLGLLLLAGSGWTAWRLLATISALLAG